MGSPQKWAQGLSRLGEPRHSAELRLLSWLKTSEVQAAHPQLQLLESRLFKKQ